MDNVYNSTNISSTDTPDYIEAEYPIVVSCFSEITESSPKNIIFCFIYFICLGTAAASAFYIYVKGKKNGHQIDRPNPE